MSRERPIPPQYDIVGPLKANHEIAQAYFDELLNIGEGVEFAHEQEQSEQERKIISGLQAAFKGFGNDIGVDLESRLPRVQDYHFFPTKEDMMEDVYRSGIFEAAIVDDIDTLGPGDAFCTPFGILAVSSPNTLKQACLLSHETVHAMHARRDKLVITEEDGHRYVDEVGSRSGYHIESVGTFHSINELTTDFTYLHLRKSKHWEEAGLPVDTYISGDLTGYLSLDIVGDELFKQVSERGGDARDLLTQIERGPFLATSNGLRVLAGFIGHDSMRALIHFNAASSPEKIKDLARELKLGGAVERIERAQRGGDDGDDAARVLEWLVL